MTDFIVILTKRNVTQANYSGGRGKNRVVHIETKYEHFAFFEHKKFNIFSSFVQGDFSYVPFGSTTYFLPLHRTYHFGTVSMTQKQNGFN